jgi:hypothetical protein
MFKTVVLILLLNFSVYPLFSTNLAGILEDIRIQTADNSPDISNRERGDDVLIRRINYIQDEIASETRCCIGRISTGSVSGQREYRYPDNVVSPIRISYYIFWSTPPAYKTLDYYPGGLSGLYNDLSSWESVPTGLPTEYYERGDYFGLKPTPALTYSTTYAIQIDYYKKPVELSSSTDIPFDGNRLLVPYHKLLVMGVVIMCLKEDGDSAAALQTEYYLLKKQMYSDIRVREDNNGASFKPISR